MIWVGACVVPSGSVKSRPAAEQAMNVVALDEEEPIATCPWPLIATEGMKYDFGLLAAGSKRVPDWTREGEVVRLPNWYQRAASRPPPLLAVPEVLTWML